MVVYTFRSAFQFKISAYNLWPSRLGELQPGTVHNSQKAYSAYTYNALNSVLLIVLSLVIDHRRQVIREIRTFHRQRLGLTGS